MKLVAGLLALAALFSINAAQAQSGYVVAFGDSNPRGKGVAPQQAYPAQLQAMLRARGYNVQVLNAGVDGDITQGMLARVDAVVPQGTRVVIVDGGHNDARFGVNPAQTVANTDAIVARLRARQIAVVLCGLRNQPRDQIASKYGAAFVPGRVCYNRQYLGPDGMHMTAAGHQLAAAGLEPVVEGLLSRSR